MNHGHHPQTVTVAANSIAAGASTVGGFTNGYLVCAIAAAAAAVIVSVLVPPGKPRAAVGHGH